jgi:hypothetical protein
LFVCVCVFVFFFLWSVFTALGGTSKTLTIRNFVHVEATCAMWKTLAFSRSGS